MRSREADRRDAARALDGPFHGAGQLPVAQSAHDGDEVAPLRVEQRKQGVGPRLLAAESANHLQADHPPHRPAGRVEGTGMHRAAHLLRPEEGRLLGRVGHEHDRRRQFPPRQEPSQLEEPCRPARVVIGTRERRRLTERIVVSTDDEQRQGCVHRSHLGDDVAVVPAPRLERLKRRSRSGRPEPAGDVGRRPIEILRMPGAPRPHRSGQELDVAPQHGGIRPRPSAPRQFRECWLPQHEAETRQPGRADDDHGDRDPRQ